MCSAILYFRSHAIWHLFGTFLFETRQQNYKFSHVKHNSFQSHLPRNNIHVQTNCSHVLNYQFQWQFSFNLRNFPYWNKFLRGLIFEFCVKNSDQIRKGKSSQNFWYTYYQINVHEECKKKTYYIWFLVKNVSNSLLQRFEIIKLQNLITKSSYAKWRHTSSY